MEKHIQEIINKEGEMREEEQPLYHTNCAENLFRSASAKYGLQVDERFIQAIIPYGAGMQTEKTCGALLGSMAALGMIFGEAKPTENKRMKSAVVRYVEQFIQKYGSIQCSVIKEHHRDEQDTCTPVKVGAGLLLDEIVSNIEDIYAAYLRQEEEEK